MTSDQILPGNAYLEALPLLLEPNTRGGASRSAFPGGAWERVVTSDIPQSPIANP
ncbi:hypothetical protein [Scytonema sp. NUACC26]|uniref:hypothetical protein n=1 Tax=Scytonema sp. NUACC26 TaxID=3140176 RepID=UPI0038B2CF3A